MDPDTRPGPEATAYHLRPSSGWLNDPNGMVFTGGRWHVFFQHNPDGPRHDRIAWGHASSADLVTWREHPVAFRPTRGGPDAFGCWSGIFVDGLQTPAVVYSGVTGPDHQSTVCLRRGSADLEHWGPPVVVATTPESDDVAVMRDPFVFTHGGRRLALLGAGLRDGTPAILLYDCDDLEDWTYLGVWLTAQDDALGAATPADVWECPQVAVWGERATLVLSLHNRGVLGDVVGCSGALVDEGGLPRLVPDTVQRLDVGTDFYAPQLADDGREGRWLMGWVREEDRDVSVADHAGCMTLPRRLVPEGDGARLLPDDRVVIGTLLSSPRPPDGPLVGRLRVEVYQEGAVLAHPVLGEHRLGAGSRVWIDGPVCEAYPATGPPGTWRHDHPWRVSGHAQVRDVL